MAFERRPGGGSVHDSGTALPAFTTYRQRYAWAAALEPGGYPHVRATTKRAKPKLTLAQAQRIAADRRAKGAKNGSRSKITLAQAQAIARKYRTVR